MIKTKKRKEVLLDEETIAILEFQAERQGRKLKNYMEFILKEKADDYELTDEYKTMMDEVLKKHKNGQLKYISKEIFFDKIDKL